MSTLWTSSVHCCNSAKPKNSELGINSVDGNKERGKEGEERGVVGAYQVLSQIKTRPWNASHAIEPKASQR